MTHEINVSVKAGLPPGIPIYIGKQAPKETALTAILYTDADVQVHADISLDEIKKLSKNKGVCWVNISGLRDMSLINQ